MLTIQKLDEGPILSIDDDEDFQFLLNFVHQQSQLANPLILLESGQECLDYLQHVVDGNKKNPSAILMDVNMPGMDGFQTVQKIRQMSSFQTIPIICMLSSSNDERDQARSLDVGANDYLEKPFDITEFTLFRHWADSRTACQ